MTDKPYDLLTPWVQAQIDAATADLSRQLAEARADAELWHSRCIGAVWLIPGEVTAGQLQDAAKEAATLRASLAESRRHAGVELSEENDRLIKQLAETRAERERLIEALNEIATFKRTGGFDAAASLQNVQAFASRVVRRAALSPPRDGEPSAALQTGEKP